MRDITDLTADAKDNLRYFADDKIVRDLLATAVDALLAAEAAIDDRYPLELDSNGPRQGNLFGGE